jgi:site-specific recombinase XerD
MANTALTLRKPVAPKEALEMAIAAFYRRCEAKNLSSHTLDYYRYRFDALRRFLKRQEVDVAPEDMTPALIRDFLADETERVSPLTAEHSFVTLRVFFRFLVDDGLLTGNPMQHVEKPKTRRKVIQTFGQEQLSAMLATAGNDFSGLRLQALLFTLADTGIRVSELCGITLNDIAWDTQTVRVVGKGNKERIVPFGAATRRVLQAYLARRGDIAGVENLFVSVYGAPLDRFRVQKIIKECGEKAGIAGVQCSPHNFRRFFAVTFIRNGGDPFTVQKILGHTDLTMTRRYAELAQTDIIAKHRQFSPGDALPQPKNGGRKRLR